MKKSTLIGALVVLFAAPSLAVAQQAPVDAAILAKPEAIGISVQDPGREIRAMEDAGGVKSLTAEQRAAIKETVSSAREQIKTVGVTRQQIQEIRAALKIKLAMLRH